jgi:hypothetical protein
MLVAMLRAVLLGILMVSYGPACSSKDDAPHAEPGAPAGTVIEVAGAVTVAAKPLAQGDAVAADDMVETGTDGSVVIVLAHNNARWELGPNKHVKAAESLAWSQPKADAIAKHVDQDSAAAGRQGEREAAQSATEAPPISSPAATTQGTATQAQHSVRAITPAPIAPPAPPPVPSPQPSAEAAEVTRGPVGRTTAVPSLNDAGADQATQLAKCLDVGQQVSIVIHVKAGVGTVSFSGSPDAKVKSCITTAVTGHSWPDATGDVKLQITR